MTIIDRVPGGYDRYEAELLAIHDDAERLTQERVLQLGALSLEEAANRYTEARDVKKQARDTIDNGSPTTTTFTDELLAENIQQFLENTYSGLKDELQRRREAETAAVR